VKTVLPALPFAGRLNMLANAPPALAEALKPLQAAHDALVLSRAQPTATAADAKQKAAPLKLDWLCSHQSQAAAARAGPILSALRTKLEPLRAKYPYLEQDLATLSSIGAAWIQVRHTSSFTLPASLHVLVIVLTSDVCAVCLGCCVVWRGVL
jgi:hypothetical protein